MLVRRMATVTIWAPAASVAWRVSSRSLNLPVPVSRREWKVRPAMTSGSEAGTLFIGRLWPAARAGGTGAMPGAQPPPRAWTTSTRSPLASGWVGWLPRGTISPLTSTATRRPARPSASSREAMVVPAATVRGSPLSTISMAVIVAFRRACRTAAWSRRAHGRSLRGSLPFQPTIPPLATTGTKEFRMSTRPLRKLLPLALALAVAPAAAGEYSRTVFFGDSLTDSGHFRSQIPASARPFTGKFTTNPALVWSEYLARYYGTDATTAVEGGDNYAQGGSRAAVPNGPADSTLTQVNAYLAASGGRADADALYTVWTGANDLFAIASGAPVESTIATAIGGTVQAVGALDAAGARYILVPSLPDMGM